MVTWFLHRFVACVEAMRCSTCVFVALFYELLQGMNPCMTGLSKVFVYEWNDRGLSGFAFVDCDSQVLQLRSFRHYIVCSDVHKSVQVLRFREDVRMIEPIASDYCNARLVRLGSFRCLSDRISRLIRQGCGCSKFWCQSQCTICCLQ